jgi:hypothetical protein
LMLLLKSSCIKKIRKFGIGLTNLIGTQTEYMGNVQMLKGVFRPCCESPTYEQVA